MTRTDRVDLNSYLDGELGPDEAAELEARLAEDPEERARLDVYARQKALIAEALSDIAADQPEDIRTTRQKRRLADAMMQRLAPRRARMSGPFLRSVAQVAAACALVSFGWWGHASWAPGPLDGASQGVFQSASLVPEYVSEAIGAHRVFAEDPVRPVEFAGTAMDSAAEWFTRKIGVPVAAPDLAGYDITLVGARLLGTKEGPLAQFIYEDAEGARYSLTMARHPVDRPLAPLQLVDYPEREVGYWSTANIDFALVGNKTGASVRTIASGLAKDI